MVRGEGIEGIEGTGWGMGGLTRISALGIQTLSCCCCWVVGHELVQVCLTMSAVPCEAYEECYM